VPPVPIGEEAGPKNRSGWYREVAIRDPSGTWTPTPQPVAVLTLSHNTVLFLTTAVGTSNPTKFLFSLYRSSKLNVLRDQYLGADVLDRVHKLCMVKQLVKAVRAIVLCGLWSDSLQFMEPFYMSLWNDRLVGFTSHSTLKTRQDLLKNVLTFSASFLCKLCMEYIVYVMWLRFPTALFKMLYRLLQKSSVQYQPISALV
jgi:hypothetical protein